MRFCANGPIIPDSLIERRDHGRVVFLCGAGVSLNSGMPTFVELTQHVIDFFDPSPKSALASAFQPWRKGSDQPMVPLDQIFHLLHQEYGREDVNALVANRLRLEESGSTVSKEHQIITKISSDRESNPQIVTTNFDLLFESSSPGLSSYEPPGLPDIRLSVPLTGITYLHGRLKAANSAQHLYVLSSADFGRAYLSEAWATNFMRALLESYTVVLVGYQAEDPPVRYLLQGLNHDERSSSSNLYAFDKGEFEEIEAKWRDRGVSAIAYREHEDLWNTLEEWANLADDSRAWRSKVIDLAKKSPRELSAHERGQVAHLVRTTPGAKLFAEAEPSPPSEWLCVFDAKCRSAEESQGYGENAERFDPLEEYCLDDDPPRPTEHQDEDLPTAYDNLLEWRPGDTNPTSSHKLSEPRVGQFIEMPPRLFHLSLWLNKNINSPITVWWAARQHGLHPRLLEAIRRHLNRGDELDPKCRRLWHLILEYQENGRNVDWDFSWYDLRDRANREGWRSSTIRQFEEVTRPGLSYSRPHGVEKSKPPFQDWEKTVLSEFGTWELHTVDPLRDAIDIPEEALEDAFRIVQNHLYRAIGLMKEIEVPFFSSPTCYPDRDREGTEIRREPFFQYVLALFRRLAEVFPAKARTYTLSWSIEDDFYFRNLKLFALNQPALFHGDEAANWLLSLTQSSFWDIDSRREIMFLLRDRWEEFSEANRETLVERLLQGPDKREYWADDDYPLLRDELSCLYVHWLVIEGKEILKNQRHRLEEKISGLPEWDENFAHGFMTGRLGRSGWVKTDETPDSLLHAPVNMVVEKTMEESQRDIATFTERRPFIGLVKANPRKALAALSLETRSGNCPIDLWSSLISEWPKETRSRLYEVLLQRMARLPYNAIEELRHTVGRWIEKDFLNTYKHDPALAWTVFDHLVAGLTSSDGTSTASGIVEERVAGKVVNRSRRTYSHAINGPIGECTEGLIDALNFLGLDKAAGIPDEFMTRIERLISAPGEGGDHTVCILTRQLPWLYYIDPEWALKRIMPWFSFDNPLSEPAWNGFLSAATIPPAELWEQFKPLFLEIFPRIYTWNWHRDLAKIAAQIIVELGTYERDQVEGLTTGEAKNCLRSMNDESRREAIFRLADIGKREENSGWEAHVIPFIDNVWPRERVFRTSKLVKAWVSLLDDTGDNFPTVLRTVRRFLVPVSGQNHWLYKFTREVNEEEPITNMFPAEVLELLDAIVASNPEDAPYELGQILILVEEADVKLTRDRRFLRLLNLVENV